ncbi:MAG: heavy metal translocating P-type ATPase, partial [Candidatus Thermoplasmatota archaeon]|nr:heavy metal translocating P-type ATPase [Candidatus Thermoplasmatota archaeon]
IGAFFGGDWAEALMVSILVAIAAHMEESALIKAREAMQGGLDRLPRRARKVKSIGNITGISLAVPTQQISVMNQMKECGVEDDLVSVELLVDGDHVEIRSGEIVPVDGIVVEGIGSLNRAPLTGESIPVRVTKGDEVNAGLVLDRGPITVKATAVGSATRLSGLIEEVRTFRDRPPRIQGSIEAFSRWWVPTVLVGAPLAGIISGDVRLTLLLWVVACPCALLLAAPVPHAAALSVASLAGVVARGGDALEAASHVDLALLDKTGTLTSGHPRLHDIHLAKSQKKDNILKIAAGLEKRSNHPYAAVILKEAGQIGAAKITSLKDGNAGVEGVHGGKQVMFGRKDWIEENGISIPPEILQDIDKTMGLSILSKGKSAIAAFTFIHDDLRPGAAEMIHDLQSIGVAVELLSGDRQEAVEALGKEIGIPAIQCRGEIDPEGKAVWVERRSQGRRTLMAGDGFNDAAALAVADVGVAVGSGEQVNLDAADVLIPGEDPRAITSFLKIAKKTRAIVRFNLLLSILVTVFLVGAVMLGLDNLAIAVAVHELSAFVVILNGAFLASAGNRVSLFLSIFSSLFQDYYDAFKLLFSKESPL